VRFSLQPMPATNDAEVRSALRDQRRVSVAIATGASSRGIKLLIGSQQLGFDKRSLVPGEKNACLPESAEQKRARLTSRERQILQLIAKGLHNRQIARKIHRSIKTVEKHRQSLHSKLSTHEVAGLTRHALAMGLTDCSSRAQQRLNRRAKLLTPRELEVLKLVAEGSGNKWIASELHRSIKTVDHHRENIMRKLGIHEVAGLTSYAVSLGLL
jgi:DNA-binding NarL/FixJ family response regulator